MSANSYRLTWSVHGIRFLFLKITKSASFHGVLAIYATIGFFLYTFVCRILLMVPEFRPSRRYVHPNRFHVHTTDYAHSVYPPIDHTKQTCRLSYRPISIIRFSLEINRRHKRMIIKRVILFMEITLFFLHKIESFWNRKLSMKRVYITQISVAWVRPTASH